jgi:type IV secretion system protein VirB8
LDEGWEKLVITSALVMPPREELGEASTMLLGANELDSYLADAKSFDDDRIERLIRSERRAWRVAGLFGAGMLVLCFAISGLAPLKSVAPPVVVQVDRETGQADVLTVTNGQKVVPASEREQKYWLEQYVVARESYTWADREAHFRKVSLMSDVGEQNRYARSVDATNPQSPQTALGRDGVIEVHVKSISLGLSKGASASARFTRTVRDLKSGAEQTTVWVATVTYSFAELPMKEQDIYINPRGFTVFAYRLDEEVQK